MNATLNADSNSAGSSLAPRTWASQNTAASMVVEPAFLTESPSSPLPTNLGRVKISKRDLANLTSQLSIMLQTGIDISSALQSLARQSRRPQHAALLRAIHADVLEGHSFSAALRPYRKLFGESYIATVAAGEASGRMADILAQLAGLQRGELRLRSSMRTLAVYPVLLVAISAVVTAALVLFVLPRFAEIFAQFDTPLPVITRLLLAVSMLLLDYLWLWVPIAAVGLVAMAFFVRSLAGQRFWHHLLLNAWLLREVSRTLLVGRVCRLLGLMLDSGVPLLESLGIVRSSVNNVLYKDLFAKLEQNVVNGRGIGEVVLGSSFIPSSAAEMLVTAERTGNLSTVTRLIGEHFEEEAEVRLRDIVTVVEPLITIGMGAVVATVVLAVMLPMFDMATFAQG